MQKSDDAQSAKTTRRQVRPSTTLNRKYLKRPVKKIDNTVMQKDRVKEAEASSIAVTIKKESSPMKAEKHPMQISANAKMEKRKAANEAQPRKMTAKELKDQAIKRALAMANKQTAEENGSMAQKIQKGSTGKLHFGFGRVVLALACAAVAVFAIVYFVNLNMPDITLRVAAMQTGIDAAYPSYVPRDYKLTNILSEDGKVSLNFKNYTNDSEFSLVEEKSSWDSNALLENYVKVNYGDNYSTVREQGLTIYTSNNSATWVNGGVMYEITSAGNEALTKKQITTIANSL